MASRCLSIRLTRRAFALVYFYPKADTPGCTAEACSLRDSYDDLRAKGLQIIGVSEDKADARKKFQEKCKLPFSLVADSDGLVAKAFGVPTVAGFAKRQSFLIKDGTIAWRDLNASTKNQQMYGRPWQVWMRSNSAHWAYPLTIFRLRDCCSDGCERRLAVEFNLAA